MSHKSESKKILLLTSRENFIWTSMQEIIPMIEESWVSLCGKKNHDLHIINVDKDSLTEKIDLIIQSDLIVVTCFNTKIAHALRIIRHKLQVDSRIIFYLHGLATIALWPLWRFKILELMNSDDIFVGTCEGDIRSLNLTFTNSQSVKIPFTLKADALKKNLKNEEIPLVYIGRISPQKNLDQLISAYAEMGQKFWVKHPLIFYGQEDHLGYPNVGLHERSYLEKLLALVSNCGLESHIHFKGFLERLEIQKELGTKYIFISPSTHSDENFGMAAFRSLISGASCILSDWGGHKEFNTAFKERIFYLKPLLADTGPYISFENFKSCLLNASLKFNSSCEEISNPFTEDYVCSKLETLLNQKTMEKIPLAKTMLANTVYTQQCFFEDHFGEHQRCFKSFEDPAFKAFFEAYSLSVL